MCKSLPLIGSKVDPVKTVLYKVWQFNYRNSPKFAHLVTVGFCHLQSAPLLKLCTLSDGGTIAGNIIWIRFLENILVILLRVSVVSANYCPFRTFSLSEIAKNYREVSLENKADGPFFKDLLGRKSGSPNALCAGVLSRVKKPLLLPKFGPLPLNRFSLPSRLIQKSMLMFGLTLC